MAITEIWTDARVGAADGREPVAGGDGREPVAGGRRGRRAGRQLWALLHAQGLIKGTEGSRDVATFVEDDRRRMSPRRAN